MTIYLPHIQPGMVVRLFKYGNQRCDWWAIVTSAETDEAWPNIKAFIGPPSELSIDNIGSQFTIVSPDEIPDEVYRVLVVWQLTGEGHTWD